MGFGARAALPSLAATLRVTFSADDVLLTDSGTTALALAIAASLEGDTRAAVALPAYSCYDVATAADAAGAPVVLYDLEPDTLSPSWGSLERALATGARAVVVAHLYGYPVDMPRALECCRAAGAVLIEDAAQGAGGRLGGGVLGTLGPLAVLSFGRGKGITGGSGGALLARGAGVPLLERARRRVSGVPAPWRSLLALTGQRLLTHPAVYGLPASLPWLKLGETLYRPPSPPRAMHPAAAAAAARALGPVTAEAGIRRGHAAALASAALSGRRFRPVTPIAGSEPGYLRLAGTIEDVGALEPEARQLGIMRGYPRSLADLAGFQDRVRSPGGTYEGSRLLADRLITLPTHSLIRISDLKRLEAWLLG